MPDIYSAREIIGQYLADLGEIDNKVVVVNADLAGSCRNTMFVNRYRDRAFNVGIAEQNLVSFAAGLAAEGWKPYACTMAPFMSMRACEQVRDDVAYGNRNVKLISIYSGLSGGVSGPTHWATEDVAIIDAMPNITIVEPGDPYQAVRLLEQSLEYEGPMYIRVTTGGFPEVYKNRTNHVIGKAGVVTAGDDGTIICAGVTVQFAADAAERLKKEYDIHMRVVDMHTLKPVDEDAIIGAAKTGLIVTAHDHSLIGGLGDIVRRTLCKYDLRPKVISLGVPDIFCPIGHAPYLYHKYGYDAEGIGRTVIDALCPNEQ